jgi:hypothetical protein
VEARGRKLCQTFRLEPEFETILRDDTNRLIKWDKLDYSKQKKKDAIIIGYVAYDKEIKTARSC